MNTSTIASSERRMIVGLGVTGRSVARWWLARGIPFSIFDAREPIANEVDFLSGVTGVALHFGDADFQIIEGVTEMIVSPGVPLSHPLVAHAKASGCRIRGDIDLFMEACSVPVIGITGSNGKSTVTAMLGEMIAACGANVAIGGNFGRPALDLLSDKAEFYVLELSSFQLERAELLGFSASTVLNISEDHLDRYHSLPAYHRAKHRIFGGAKAVVANKDDPLTVPIQYDHTPVTWWRAGEPDLEEFGIRYQDGVAWLYRGIDPLLSSQELLLSGGHNLSNTLAALALGTALGFPIAPLLEGARKFRGLPHRCQLIAEIDSVQYIDDSKATNVGATIAALTGLAEQGKIWLILGGQGKGQDFSLLRKCISQGCGAVFVLGESALDIERSLNDLVPVYKVNSMESAVASAASSAQSGHIVLLSPACASFDMFEDYIQRGMTFQKAVNSLRVAA